MDWLKPFMTKRFCRKGDVLFAKDAVADEMYYTMSGRYRLTEMGIDIPPGQIIGELGMLAPSNRRTASFECTEDGMLLTVTYQQVKELYFQNPEFGFDLCGSRPRGCSTTSRGCRIRSSSCGQSRREAARNLTLRASSPARVAQRPESGRPSNRYPPYHAPVRKSMIFGVYWVARFRGQ